MFSNPEDEVLDTLSKQHSFSDARYPSLIEFTFLFESGIIEVVGSYFDSGKEDIVFVSRLRRNERMMQ